MYQLTIDRAVWLRGEDSALLKYCDGARKQCCVGIYLTSLGVQDSFLLGKGIACMAIVPSGGYERLYPKESWWLLKDKGKGITDSSAAHMLYYLNDDYCFSPQEREIRIAEEFSKHGVNITFMG